MNKSKPRICGPYRLAGLAALAILASALLGAPAFACQRPGVAPSKVAWEGDPQMRATPAVGVSPLFAVDYMLADSDGNSSVIGMWHAVLRLGSATGPVYDEVLEQFHSDGTEILISNGLPPALGNVCIGVWKRIGARAYKLRHMTWNWAPPDNGFGVPGTFSGHFELEITLRLDSHGRTYRGTWTAKNFDLSGDHIPGLDAEGVVTATRITVN
jgi:hypothetical protein